MTNVNEIFRKKVESILANDHSHTLYFFKGFAYSQIQYLVSHPCSLLNTPELFEDDCLHLNVLDDKWMDVLVNIKLTDGSLVGFYEELLAMREFISKIQVDKIVVIENNMLSPWEPSLIPMQDTYTFFDFQQEEHEPQTAMLKTLTHYYADVKILDEHRALLLPGILDEESIEVRAFWTCESETIPSDSDAAVLDAGSLEDWSYREGLLNGNSNSIVIQYRGTQMDKLAGLQAALAELKIPCTFVDARKIISRKVYDDSQFLTYLRKYWGDKADFRPLLFYKQPDRNHETEIISQGQIIAEIVEQCELAAAEKPYSNVFITAPTGSGKSILFQLPALYMAERHKMVTIVVSPLIALMNDQVDQLQHERGISIAACINSTMTMEERIDAIAQIQSGEKSLLYLAPELLLTTNLQSFLGGRPVGLVVIDEAHTVTSWGRDFRSDYWFLGDFLKKAKRNGLRFPVLCLTATAVYSGEDDVVNDTINELDLGKTIIHLGNVRRNNIHFDIQRHDRGKISGKIEEVKEELIIEEMQKYIRQDEKVLVYFPYRSHVDHAYDQLDGHMGGKIRRYHSKISTAERKLVEADYKSGEAMGLFCTKAFGMGIDVADIKHVIHFAPTGTLADYVQEIGRAARNPDIDGIAHIDYFNSDLRYVRTLNNLSEMRQYQLKEMLKKLCSIYDYKKRRNLLISAETFEYLFPEDEVENRTKSGLMLLAKDLSNKYTFPVLVVRPKAMLSKNYVHIPTELEPVFQQKYGIYAQRKTGSSRRTVFSENHQRASDMTVYSTGDTYLVDMAAIWENCYPDRSFGLFKKEFFEKPYTVKGKTYHFAPRVQVEISYKEAYETVVERVEQVLTAMVDVFSQYKNAEAKQFTRPMFEKDLQDKLGEKVVSHDKISMLLDIFTETVNENAAYTHTRSQIRVLRKRKQVRGEETVYFVSNSAYARLNSIFARMLKQCSPHGESSKFVRFYPLIKDKPIELMPVLRLLELLNLATYEIRGGEKAEVFIRINDPEKLRHLAYGNYRNTVLQAIQNRHKHNQQLVEAFFDTEMTDESRWELIEQYFLGNEQYVNEQLQIDG